VDTARDKNTRELIEAEGLWNLTSVDQNGYICRGCEVAVFPASFDKQRNKRRPYFTLGPVNKHESKCDVDGEEKLVKRAKGGSIGREDGFPLPFPNQLVLSEERSVVSGGSPQGSGSGSGTSGNRGSGQGNARGHHGHTVKTIRPACRAFINFPHDRSSLPLSVPGVYGRTYAEVFWSLGGKPPPRFKNPKHLYYAAIRWKEKPIQTEQQCILTLNVGEWDEDQREYKSLSRVLVDWSSWSQTRRDSLIREFETTREEAAEQAKKNRYVKGWLFFVGVQDEADCEVFHVDDYRLVCSLSGEMVWPSL